MLANFEIATNFKKRNVEDVQMLETENIKIAIEKVLLLDRDMNIAVWFKPDMTYGEVIILDDNFEEERFVKITKK